MSEENPPPYFLFCSACYTPCSGDDAHVIPRWNRDAHRVLTTYRCGNCWLGSLAELRATVTSGDAEVRSSFCEFLARHGYGEDAATIGAAPDGRQQTLLVEIVDAMEARTITFQP